MAMSSSWNRTLSRAALLLAGAGLSAALMSSPAQALRIEGYVEGSINSSFNEVLGDGVDVFGLTTGELFGQAVRIDFAYDTDLAPPEQNRFLGSRQYQTDGGVPVWLQMSITVNGRTFQTGSTFQYADLGGSDDPLSTGPDRFQLSGQHYEDIEFGNRRDFIEIVLQMPSGTIPFEGLPTRIERVAPVGAPVSGVTFRINDFIFDEVTREVLSQRRVSFDVDVDAIEIYPVPEPSTALLVALGLAALTAQSPRRR